jgi:hypothetical protein
MADVVKLDPGYYADPDIGRPIANGYFYVGIKDLDPEIPANQKQVTVRQESGVEVQIAQPVDLGSGGVPEYLGSPVTVLVDGVYSLKVFDSHDIQQYYIPESEASISGLIGYDHNSDGSHIVYSSISDLRASTLTPFDGQKISLTGYYTEGDGGGGDFYWGATSTETDNNGTIIKVTAITTGRWIRLNQDGSFLNAQWFGAVGSSDVTSAIQDALDVIDTSLGGTVYLPGGTYKTSSTLIVDSQFTQIVGDADTITSINFTPSAADTAIFFGLGGEGGVDGGVIFKGGVRRLRILSSDTTYKKIGIDLKDTSSFVVEDVTTGPRTKWNGAGSIGLRTRGREFLSVNRCNFAADNPINIDVNPNSSTIHADLFNFNNLYLQAEIGYANILVSDGVLLSNTIFGGYQSWVNGTHGFYWSNTTSPGASHNVIFNNVRFEQPAVTTGWTFYIDHGTGSRLTGLEFNNAYAPTGSQGWYLRDTNRVKLINTNYASSSLVAMDFDDVFDLSLDNAWWQTGSTANIPSDYRLSLARYTDNSAPLPVSGQYDNSTTAGRSNIITGGPIHQFSELTVAVDEARALPIPDDSRGFIFIADLTGGGAMVGITTTSHALTEYHDIQGLYSTTKDTASMYNIYWDTDTYYIQNKRGSAASFYFQIIGVSD